MFIKNSLIDQYIKYLKLFFNKFFCIILKLLETYKINFNNYLNKDYQVQAFILDLLIFYLILILL